MCVYIITKKPPNYSALDSTLSLVDCNKRENIYCQGIDLSLLKDSLLSIAVADRDLGKKTIVELENKRDAMSYNLCLRCLRDQEIENCL